MRVAVVDIGTNSTRLLIGDVDGGSHVAELDRRSIVTRLGQGVDRTGVLANEAMERVFAVLADYRAALDAAHVERTTAVLTSAVRDAANGDEFTRTVAERYGLEARAISGDEAARLSFLGATSDREGDGARLVVIDIGGGSTEFVAGVHGQVEFHVSTQAGVVRHTERFLRSDPPAPEELQLLAADVSDAFTASIPADVRAAVRAGIAVAGTATSLAAIVQRLEPYDPARVHGYRLERGACGEMRGILGALSP